MFTTKLKDGPYVSVEFKVFQATADACCLTSEYTDNEGNRKKMPFSYRVRCTVRTAPPARSLPDLCYTDFRVFSIDSAFCSVKDKFDEDTGRRLALQRAIRQFPKDLRAQIWERYLIQTGVIRERCAS